MTADRLRATSMMLVVMCLMSTPAVAQQPGCEVVMPRAFRLLEQQAPSTGGPDYPAQTRVRAIAFGSARQGGTRAVRVRIDSAEGWLFLWPSQTRACPQGSIAPRAGDVGAAATPPPSTAPASPPRACVPGATQACLCVGGASGVQSCNAAGSGFDPCSCVRPEPPPSTGSGGEIVRERPLPPTRGGGEIVRERPLPPTGNGGEIVRERPLCANVAEACRPGRLECCSRDLRCQLMSDPNPSTIRDWVWECRPCGREGQRCCRGPGSRACVPGSCAPGLEYDPESEVCHAQSRDGVGTW
jgi:hypothetical protein